MQDTANIAVFIPRTLTLTQFIGGVAFLFIIIGYLMYIRGDKIQEIVTEKKDITNVRSATIILFIFAIILWYFKEMRDNFWYKIEDEFKYDLTDACKFSTIKSRLLISGGLLPNKLVTSNFPPVVFM